MHFSHGQISFIVFFVAVFSIALIWAYKKDRPTNSRYYHGTWKILLTVIIVFAVISYILKNLRAH